MSALALRDLPVAPNGHVAHEAFARLLRDCRERAGLSQNALAGRIRRNPSYINRLESGERGRPTERVVLAIARGLGLSPADTDTLLLAAGFAPTWLRYLGGEDPTVQALAALLTDDRLDDSTIVDARAVIETVIARFSGRVLPARRVARRLPG
jgi:transcriptional regulator with XRE-family HTH domain